LSGGMRRALDIARGMLHEPRVLFLDEPTAGLDPRARRSLWELVQRLRAASGLTVFLTTHYVEEAEPCDRVAVLDCGRLAVLGAPIRRSTVALGKTLSATLLGTTQAIAVGTILLSLVRLWPGCAGLLLAFAAIVLSSLALGALGLLLAASIHSLENFAGVMN